MPLSVDPTVTQESKTGTTVNGIHTCSTLSLVVTKGSLQWFQLLQWQWQNCPRTPVRPIVFFDDEADQGEKTAALVPNEKDEDEEERNAEETSKCVSGNALLDDGGAPSDALDVDDEEDTAVDLHDSCEKSRDDDAVNITTSTSASSQLSQQMEWLHEAIADNLVRLQHTRDLLEEQLERLRRRQSHAQSIRTLILASMTTTMEPSSPSSR